MDDQAFLRVLRSEPDNEEVRFAYWNWLEERGDTRAPYVRLKRRREKLEKELEETDFLLQASERHLDDEWIDIAFPMRIRSPMAGKCYLRPLPDALNFVEVGVEVMPDTVVCIVEALKVFYEITAGFQGVLAEIAVANGSTVEVEQILFRVKRTPAGYGWT